MAQSLEKPKLTMRLIIDEKKNRVVIAEVGKDFVDVLCSLLTLPMGTVIRLLEKHENPRSSIVGCFHNLYRSVSEMDVDNFENQACKDLLLHPRSMKETHWRRLKLNVDDTEATKLFLCSRFLTPVTWCRVYSKFSTSMCSCGNLMTKEIEVEEEGEQVDEVLVSWRTSFIVTDDLKVSLNSTGIVLSVLNDLGYDGFDKLKERNIDVGSEEMVTLLGCLFTSDAPLTDAFLRRKHCLKRKPKILTPLVQESRVAEKLIALKVYVRKTDKAILYAECREDFVDFLFTFLAIPLEFAWELCIDNANMGCIGNLCRSVKGLSSEEEGEATASKYMLPHYYNCGAQLLDVVIQEMPAYECLVSRYYTVDGNRISKLSKKIKKHPLAIGESILKLVPVDLKSSGSAGTGFVKGKTSFIVSDDFVVTPMNSSSTFSFLSKLQMKISDIEEQVIKIGKAEAISLLRASLITNSALNNGLSNFLSKTNQNKATQSTFKKPKPKETL